MNTKAVCDGFGLGDVVSETPVISGLINSSYKITLRKGDSYFLQKINTNVFPNPLAIQTNYNLIQQQVAAESNMQLPGLIHTANGNLLYEQNGEVWRCFTFLNGTYSRDVVRTPDVAYEVARCFGQFTATMQTFPPNGLQTILPRFHDLRWRYDQFTAALQQAPYKRKENVKNLIQQVENYKPLLQLFAEINTDKQKFPLHILHHDCKISNILFDEQTNAVRCPIDFDTTQPGLFFSDMGDMIRTIVCSEDENEADTDKLAVRPLFYKAVTEGYLEAMAPYVTGNEKGYLNKAGSLLLYMQALRFLTDHLNGNVYYKTAYPDQNKHRAANQLRLLYLLEDFIG